MSRSRFVTGEIVRLALSEDDWIEVKARLTFGEQQRLLGSAIGGVRDGQQGAELGIDMERFEIERLATWLYEWSFRDDSGKRMPLSRDAISALDPDTAAEIKAALDRHVEAQAEAKKATSGTPTPTTPSR